MNHCKSAYSVMLFAFLISTITPIADIFAQRKWERKIIKINNFFEEGNTQKAGAILKRAKRKTAKKLGSENKFMPTLLLFEARQNLTVSVMTHFQDNIEAAIALSAKNDGEDHLNYKRIIYQAANLYTEGGYFNDAALLFKRLLPLPDTLLPATLPEINLGFAQALAGQGYYFKAVEILHAQQEAFTKRLIKVEMVTDSKGNLKKKKLSKKEVRQRFAQYYKLLTLNASILGKQGNLNSADSLFEYVSKLSKKEMGKKSLSYIYNKVENAKILLENGIENLPADMDLQKMIIRVSKKMRPIHPLALELQMMDLKDLIVHGKDTGFEYRKNKLNNTIGQSIGGVSIYRVGIKLLEYDPHILSGKRKLLYEKQEVSTLFNSAAGLPNNNPLSIDVFESLRDIALYTKRYDEAGKMLEKIVEVKIKLCGSDAPETHLARIQQANFLLDYTNQIAKAKEIYDQSYYASVKDQISPYHKNFIDMLNHIARMAELNDNFKEATEALDQALYLSRSKYDDKDFKYGEELNFIARLQIKLGQYDKAALNIAKSVSVLDEYKRDDEKVVGYTRALQTKAILEGIYGDFDGARQTLRQSARESKKNEIFSGNDELTTGLELSSLYVQLGEYRKAEKLLPDLIKNVEQMYGGNSLLLAEPLNTLGRLKFAKGEYSEALKITERSYAIANQVFGPSSTKTAIVKSLLSDIYFALGNYPKAEALVNEALTNQELRFGSDHVEVAKSKSKLALIKFNQNEDPAIIEKMIIESRNVMARKLGDGNPQYAEVLKQMAAFYTSQNKFDVAFASLTQAGLIWKNKTSIGGIENVHMGEIYSLTADTYYQMKNYDKADHFYNQALQVYDKYFKDGHPDYARIQAQLARACYMNQEFRKARRNIESALNSHEQYLKKIFPSLSEYEKTRYWNTIKGDFEFYNTLAFSRVDDFKGLSEKIYNYQLLTKALLLSSSIKIRERVNASFDEDLKKSYNDWVQKKESLTAAYSMSTDQLKENNLDMTLLEADVEKLEKSLSEKAEIFGDSFDANKYSYEQIQKGLKTNEVAMEMVRFRHFDHSFTDSIVYVGLYIRDSGRPKIIEFSDGKKMEGRYMSYYRNSMINRQTDEYSYKIFWEPIKNEIGAHSALYLSPDGIYNQINLEAIPSPDGRFVIDDSNVIIVSNTRDLAKRKPVLLSKGSFSYASATVIGNPSFYLTSSTDARSVVSLPGTEAEVQALEDLFKQTGIKTKKFMDNSASEEIIKELENPSIFHIATHGFYAATDAEEGKSNMTKNPLLKSGLLLKGAGDILEKDKYNYNSENGILTSYEAMNLNLDNTSLVVLSACETGLGDVANGEGVYGLQRAFMVAGARSLIMSIFKVDDESTKKLMLSFYSKWLSTGQLRESFIEAKKEIRTTNPDPIYWGSFMMIGL